MQGIWYGDRRDRVKWAALIWLAKEFDIRNIIQIAYFGGEVEHVIETPTGDEPISPTVWKHFSELSNIQNLATATGLDIDVFADLFEPGHRAEYIARAVERISGTRAPRIVFLDPDTGVAPKKAEAQHVAVEDLQAIWTALEPGDILAVYQHADRTETWLQQRSAALSAACGGAMVEVIRGHTIARDVAILFCHKT